MRLKQLGKLESYEVLPHDPEEVEEDPRVNYLDISTGELGIPIKYDLGEGLGK